MDTYSPKKAPDPEVWLELDEQERIALIEDYHEAKGIDLPNITLHAAIHAIVENQLAEGIEEVVETMQRLRKDGLTRHDCLHAIGAVLTEHMHHLMSGGATGDDPNAAYHSALRKLTAESWRNM